MLSLLSRAGDSGWTICLTEDTLPLGHDLARIGSRRMLLPAFHRCLDMPLSRYLAPLLTAVQSQGPLGQPNSTSPMIKRRRS